MEEKRDKMLAWQLIRHSSPYDSFVLAAIPRPVPGPGEVRIKVRASGLNYADIMARQGLYRECPPLPAIIGYDVEGIVDALGEGVSRFKPGDEVFALTRFGGYASYVCTRQEAIGHLPTGAPVGSGCALATQYVTAVHAAMHCQTLMPGEKVLIHAAAGGLGTALIQICQWKGCEVIGVAGGSEKITYLRSLGVMHAIDHQEVDYVEYVQQHFHGRVDVVFDNIGGASVKKAKSILARGGRIVTLGAAAISGKKSFLAKLKLGVGFGFFSPISYLTKSQSLIGVNMLKIADHRPDIIASEFLLVQNFHEQGILKPHIGKIFPNDQLPQAHEWMENRRSIGKIIFTWES